ncbi:AIPR family protein [Dolichospermum circinale CS-1225]|uniref:AIPR family protein n=1 Tax=Dolichospermum circinale CS-537/01 TaxID=3021739 RepID=A0ABT5A4C6_9CYAN|nr:AIPR family protein [Dolichospermum circinale]MDB9486783.1 AIPR family protein [Dolichospermum circinale CS-537/01]MDB9520377.1 AIPR family protein [Dolichospermum circinale CS-1225]
MSKPNTKAQKTQIIEVLKQDYFPMIPELERNWTPEQHDKNRLSRSLAAFAIANLADLTPSQAAHSIINGGDDNGIDAVYFDRVNNRLWLVQAKAGKAPNMGDNKKFCDGIRDLVHKRFQKFNSSFSRLQHDVEDALDRNGVKIVGCNIYLDDSLGTHVVNDLNQLKDELNQFDSRFEWRDLNFENIYRWLTAKQENAPIEVKLTLEKWHCLEHKRRAFYGLVNAAELADLYKQHNKLLFERNIRYYLGTQDVNEAIAQTVKEQPLELFYLNNGLTITCAKVSLPSGHNQDSTKFTLEGFSVVNGAQTVGSIASVFNDNGAISPNAKLLVTIIEVGTQSDTIGIEITKARNTQNTVRDIYFAALDPNQERLRQECMVSNIVYQYRPSADNQDAITIEQAAIALACFSGNAEIIVAAKKNLNLLYKDHYSTLFSNELSGITLCRYVRIFQYLDQIFEDSRKAETETRRKNFYQHGRLFILNILSRRYKSLINKPEVNLSQDDMTEFSNVGIELAELIYTLAESQFASDEKGYLAIFRSLTDVQQLMTKVMQELAQNNS